MDNTDKDLKDDNPSIKYIEDEIKIVDWEKHQQMLKKHKKKKKRNKQ